MAFSQQSALVYEKSVEEAVASSYETPPESNLERTLDKTILYFLCNVFGVPS
jgi:hypothetical protein